MRKGPKGGKMRKNGWRCPGLLAALFFWAVVMLGCQVDLAGDEEQSPDPQPAAEGQQGLVIENKSELPDTYPRAPYEFLFLAHGGTPPLRWRVEKGALPPGLKLDTNGRLSGAAERMGEFQFTVSVRDAQQNGVQKVFILRVRS